MRYYEKRLLRARAMRDFEEDVDTRASRMYSIYHDREARNLARAMNSGRVSEAKRAARKIDRAWEAFKNTYASDSDEDSD